MKQHEQNALEFAKYLESHTAFDKVIYPGLESHPEHKLASTQCSGYGGMVSAYLSEEYDLDVFTKQLKVFSLAESLGAVESLVNVPSKMTHVSVPLEERVKLGIADNLLRFSVGLEDVDDLMTDVNRALA